MKRAVRFTEEMKGYYAPAAESYEAGFYTGRSYGTAAMFHLTIGTDDLAAHRADPMHPCRAEGYVEAPALGAGPLTLDHGTFNLFAPGLAPGRTAMRYRLWFTGDGGQPYTLNGYKDVGNDKGFDLWRDTTTLFTRIAKGHTDELDPDPAAELGRGLLHLDARMFAHQLTTFRGDPVGVAIFAGNFGGSLLRQYARLPREGDEVMNAVLTPGPAGDLLVTDVVPLTALDGLALNLHHVRGAREPTRGPVLVVHGAGVRANIFRPPEPLDFVRALVDDGFDVWLENWRASIDLAPNPWDLDQAAVYDHPAAVAKVLELTGATTLKAVVHCQGSTSFTLAAVSGLLPEVTTIVSNAVSLHPIVPPVAHVKIRLAAPQMAKFLTYVDCQWGREAPPGWLPRAIVKGVQLVHRECDNPVCHMVSFTYGVGFPALWSHRNLSPATHEWLSGEFAAVPLRFFLQIGRSIARGHLVTAERFPTLPANPTARPPETGARFALFAGADNRCFLAESQERTFAFLDGHRPGFHRLHVIPGYGHLDMFMGRNAARDVFPLMLQELR